MEGPELKEISRETVPEDLGDRLVAKVGQLKIGLRLVLCLERLVLLVLMLLGVGLLGLLYILYWTPGPAGTWAFSFVTVAAVGYVFLKFIHARRRRGLTNLAMSAWIERSIPSLQDRLITAVELSEGVRLASGGSLPELFDPTFVAAFFRETEAVIQRTFLSRVLLRKRLLALLGVLLLVLLLFRNSHYFSIYTARDLRRIYLDTHLALLRGQGAVFVVEPGDVMIPRGEDLDVKAYSVRPGRRRDLEIFYRAEGQSWESAAMERTESEDYRFQFQKLSQPLEYFVTDAQADSQVFRIQLADRPELSSLRVQLMHPAYTGLGTVIGKEGQGEIRALAGTRAKIVVQFRQSMEKVELIRGTGEAEAAERQISRFNMTESAGSWTGEFVVEKPGWYRISATNPEGYATGKELTYPILLLEDEKPGVRITHPTGPIDFLRTDDFPELRAGKYPKVPIRYDAVDDFGIARVELHYSQLGGVTAHRVLAEYGYGEKAISGSYQWDIEQFWGGGSVSYYVRAYDHLGLKEERERGQSEHFGESGRLELYWGRNLDPAREESPPEEPAQGQEGEEPGSGKGEGEERLSDDLDALAEQMARLRQQQQDINEEAERQGTEQQPEPSSTETAEELTGEQEQIAEGAAEVRRNLRSQAREFRRRKEIDKETEPTREELPPREEKEEKPDAEEIARRMNEVADALEKQRIEQTPEGFKTRSGLEGEMRLNQQRLAQARFEQAAQKGRQLEGQLEQLEQELRKLARMSGSGTGQGAAAASSQGQAPAEGALSRGEQTSEMDEMGAGKDIGEGSLRSVASYDDYRPSQWEPPPIKDLGRRAGRLGEFIDAAPQRDPFGDTPPEERYPLKYEGLVEQYFQSLAESGQ